MILRNRSPGSLFFPPSKLVDAIGGSLGVSLDLVGFDLYSPSDTDEPESLDLILRNPNLDTLVFTIKLPVMRKIMSYRYFVGIKIQLLKKLNE